ncbi:hypothetical protein NDU88_005961, partial [Pleurodeles waltl]
LQNLKNSSSEKKRPEPRGPQNQPKKEVSQGARMTQVPAVERMVMYHLKENPKELPQ